ncbi:hypothetical protein H5410_051926 [Solanum commersonii]|uniref:Uncharacterized protein n=1 Tax=Solanum commersonii TaxID=4109 RepID=A0A9J5WZT1_SOLCO|nr:hypothetical protein H5410_051926 [Solanum commersonii]
MSTHSLGHQSSGLSFATSLSGKSNYKFIKLNHKSLGEIAIKIHLTYQQARPNNNINTYLLNHTPRMGELNLDLSKGRRMEKTHFQLGKDEILLSSSLPQNPLQT